MHFRVDTVPEGLKVAPMKTEIPPITVAQMVNEGFFKPYCDMHQPLEFTPEELQRMDDERSEREVYRMEDAREDNSNPPEVE